MRAEDVDAALGCAREVWDALNAADGVRLRAVLADSEGLPDEHVVAQLRDCMIDPVGCVVAAHEAHGRFVGVVVTKSSGHGSNAIRCWVLARSDDGWRMRVEGVRAEAAHEQTAAAVARLVSYLRRRVRSAR